MTEKEIKRWSSRIARVVEYGGGFTPEERALASRWGTCALGEVVHRRLGFVLKAGPKDTALEDLGFLFYECVCADKALEARATLKKIRDRVSKLVKVKGTVEYKFDTYGGSF